MSRTRHVKPQHHSEQARYWRWRDLNAQLLEAQESDERIQHEFECQAREVREQVVFLTNGGSGAEEALATLAEEDMTNFCVMVDLAEPIAIPGVEPLPDAARRRLQRFLATEPWRSLAVDNDISVALALLDSIGAMQRDVPLRRQPHGLLDVLNAVLANVNEEQFDRFIEEYRLLQERDRFALPNQAKTVFETMVKQSAGRLGVRSPLL